MCSSSLNPAAPHSLVWKASDYRFVWVTGSSRRLPSVIYLKQSNRHWGALRLFGYLPAGAVLLWSEWESLPHCMNYWYPSWVSFASRRSTASDFEELSAIPFFALRYQCRSRWNRTSCSWDPACGMHSEPFFPAAGTGCSFPARVISAAVHCQAEGNLWLGRFRLFASARIHRIARGLRSAPSAITLQLLDHTVLSAKILLIPWTGTLRYCHSARSSSSGNSRLCSDRRRSPRSWPASISPASENYWRWCFPHWRAAAGLLCRASGTAFRIANSGSFPQFAGSASCSCPSKMPHEWPAADWCLVDFGWWISCFCGLTGWLSGIHSGCWGWPKFGWYRFWGSACSCCGWKIDLQRNWTSWICPVPWMPVAPKTG